jgi:hypothetical protein
LADDTILSDDLLRQLISVGEVDIVVGLRTHNNAKTAGHVAHMIRTGLLKFFPRERSVILNVDAGSRDGTRELVQAAGISDIRDSAAERSLRTLRCISARYAEGPTPAKALQTIVASGDLLHAKACVVLAPESSTIAPDWIDRLLRPIYAESCDLVTPVYRRNAFEGILITNLLYPLVRALYGRRIREPHPADFSFSGRFGSHLLDLELWRNEFGRMGAEVCLTTKAIADGYRLQQTFLGAKGQAETQSSDLVQAMQKTLGALFWSLDQDFATWSNGTGTHAVPTSGPEYEVASESVRVNRKRSYQMFSSAVTDLEPVLASILSPTTLDELRRGAASGEERFQYSDDLWAKTVYEFAASNHRNVISRGHIIQALVPLYRGRVHSFLGQTRGISAPHVEEHIEALCLTFEQLKPYLLTLWTKQEGGS